MRSVWILGCWENWWVTCSSWVRGIGIPALGVALLIWVTLYWTNPGSLPAYSCFVMADFWRTFLEILPGWIPCKFGARRWCISSLELQNFPKVSGSWWVWPCYTGVACSSPTSLSQKSISLSPTQSRPKHVEFYVGLDFTSLLYIAYEIVVACMTWLQSQNDMKWCTHADAKILNSKYYNDWKGRLKCQAAEPFFTALFTAVLIGHKPTLRPSASSGIPQGFCQKGSQQKAEISETKIIQRRNIIYTYIYIQYSFCKEIYTFSKAIVHA